MRRGDSNQIVFGRTSARHPLIHLLPEFIRIVGISGACMRGLAHRRLSKRTLARFLHGGEGFVLKETALLQGVDEVAFQFPYLEVAGNFDQRGAQVKFRVLAIEAVEALDQWRRDDQHGIGIMQRIAHQKARPVLYGGGHGVQIVAQAGQYGRHRTSIADGRVVHSKIHMKTAFLFPGQGSQFAGMGKSLSEAFPAARERFEQADEALGFSLSKLCFEGPDEDLKRTENTQPALVAVSVAAWTVLRQETGEPDYVAGHSLGEYSALVASGSLDFADALRLVRKRGRYMQEAVPEGVGAMAALLKLPAGKLDEVLAEAARGPQGAGIVTAANLNSADQVVIAGNAAAVDRAMEIAKAAGARRVVRLQVSAPFHCPLMRPAQERLKADLDACVFADLRVPLVNNWQAREIRTGAEARDGLFHQVPNPVRWQESMEYLAANGVDRWFEVGAGAVLSGLLKTIVAGAKCTPFGEAKDVEYLA